MNRFIFILLLTSFAIVHFTMADDINWRDNAVELKKNRHDNFELRAYPAPQEKAFNFGFGDLQQKGDSVVFSYQNNVLSFLISDGTKQDINDVVIDGKSPLIIRRHGVWLEVLTPAKRLVSVPTFAKLKGQFLVAKVDEKPAIEKLDYQRLEPFAFATTSCGRRKRQNNGAFGRPFPANGKSIPSWSASMKILPPASAKATNPSPTAAPIHSVFPRKPRRAKPSSSQAMTSGVTMKRPSPSNRSSRISV